MGGNEKNFSAKLLDLILTAIWKNVVFPTKFR
jgi:hypothetical protein